MSPVLESAPSAATVAAKPLRLRHVDSLRAVAAGLVVWTHFAETLFPYSRGNPGFLSFLHTLPPALVLGRVGVDLFFAISGFVICRSFNGPPEGSTRRFLIRRGCRLYPAFWVSMLAGVLMWLLDGNTPTLPVLAANATMAPISLGQPMLIGLYWTLNIELLFYGLCLGLHWCHRLDSRGTLAVCAVGFAATRRTLHLAGHFTGAKLDLSGEAGVWMISLGLMCWGALFRSVYEETGGFRRAPFRNRGTWLLLLVAVALLDLHDPRLQTVLFRQPADQWGERLVTLHSLVFFTLWVALFRVENRVLTFLGVVSYSLYLFHPLVLSLLVSWSRILGAGWPLWASLTAGTALSTALAAGVYWWVEHPAILFGKRWVERGRARNDPGAGQMI